MVLYTTLDKMSMDKIAIIVYYPAKKGKAVKQINKFKRIKKGYVWEKHYGMNFHIKIAAKEIRYEYPRNQVVSNKDWTLAYTFSYAGQYSINTLDSKKYERYANMARLYPPHTKYFFHEKNEHYPINGVWISFSIKNDTIFDKYVKNNTLHARFIDPTGILGQELIKISEIGYVRENKVFFEAQSKLFKVMDLLLNSSKIHDNEYRIEKKIETILESDLIGNVNMYMKNNISKKITLRGLATHFNISTSALSHRYKKETGVSPISTLQKNRIDLAKIYLLQKEKMKIIADELCFYDEHYFSKIFKKVEGITPTQFLEKMKKR